MGPVTKQLIKVLTYRDKNLDIVLLHNPPILNFETLAQTIYKNEGFSKQTYFYICSPPPF